MSGCFPVVEDESSLAEATEDISIAGLGIK